MFKNIYAYSLLFSILFGSTACSALHSPQLAAQCADGLDKVTKQYDAADAQGLGSAGSMIKAAALIAAAKIQQQFDKYPNCINKVQRAEVYIRQATAGK